MAHFIQTAIGSSNELDYWIHLSRRLKYLEPMIASKLAAQTNAVRRMLIRLLKRLRGA